jgi:hypothetical protein
VRTLVWLRHVYHDVNTPHSAGKATCTLAVDAVERAAGQPRPKRGVAGEGPQVGGQRIDVDLIGNVRHADDAPFGGAAQRLTLVVGNAKRQRRNAQRATFPGRAATGADRQVRNGQQLDHARGVHVAGGPGPRGHLGLDGGRGRVAGTDDHVQDHVVQVSDRDRLQDPASDVVSVHTAHEDEQPAYRA